MRERQKARTRAAIVAAASDLLRRGGTAPSLEDIVETAGVSRATTYRYFPGLDALLGEAAGELLVPELRDLPFDPFERLARVDEAFDAACRSQQATLRRALGRAIASATRREPSRQRMIEQALTPLAARLGPRRLERLAQALTMVIGAEGFLALNDVAGLDENGACEVRQWTIDALVAASLSEAYSPR
jgi:AcrR family transcriptional regulator